MKLLGQRPRYQEGPPRGPVPYGGPLRGRSRGEGPLGADVVSRCRTLPDDAPTPPARGWTDAPGPRPGPPCSRKNRPPRRAAPPSDAHGATPGGSARHSCPSGSVTVQSPPKPKTRGFTNL